MARIPLNVSYEVHASMVGHEEAGRALAAELASRLRKGISKEDAELLAGMLDKAAAGKPLKKAFKFAGDGRKSEIESDIRIADAVQALRDQGRTLKAACKEIASNPKDFPRVSTNGKPKPELSSETVLGIWNKIKKARKEAGAV